MELSTIYPKLVTFSEEIDKSRQKYKYSLSLTEVAYDPQKTDTKIRELVESYEEVCDKYLDFIENTENDLTRIQIVYFKSLIYNILKGNITTLKCELMVESKFIINLDIETLCSRLIYE